MRKTQVLFLFILLFIISLANAGPPITQGINKSDLGSISASQITDTGLTASKPVFTDASKVLTSSGTLAVDQGGTGVTTSTGTVAVVLSTSPTLVTPNIGAATATTVTINGAIYWASATSVADDGTVTLPTITADSSAHGWIRASRSVAITESAEFEINSAGTAVIIRGTANVVVNADTDDKLCIGTAAGQNPIIVKNRLGGANHKVAIELWYN